MQNYTNLVTVTGLVSALVCVNFIFLGKDLVTALLVIEGTWISLYFLLSFIVIFTGLHTSGLLMPLILILAGLEVVVGFYFLYYI